MSSNIEFIMFAVDQARAAEEFGFTRNQCCRNLKLAIMHYWQSRTMGMRNLAKRRLHRSVAAEGLDLSACRTEHAVPMQVIVDLLLDNPDLTKKSLEKTLSRLVTVRVVTKEEDRRLVEAGLRFMMPADWDGRDPWARYRVVGIKIRGGYPSPA